MSIEPTIPILYGMGGQAGRLVHDAAQQPEMAQAVSRNVVLQTLRHDSEQVKKTSESQLETKMRDDREGASNGFSASQQHQDAKTEQTEPEQLEDSTDPLIGNLLNMKI